MCLILIAFQQDPDYPLIIAANRDESYSRPSKTGHFWEDEPEVFGGRDLQAGGTWMGVTRTGRFAAVTNYREAVAPRGDLKSRGDLVKGFLTSQIDPHEYLKNIQRCKDQYTGFNLLVGSASELFCYSNREPDIVRIESGVHGLSNGSLNEPWPKVAGGKSALAEKISYRASPEEMQSILLDTTTVNVDLLPDTGVGLEAEEMLSSRFIRTELYGTCTTTVLKFDNHHRIDWFEQSFDSKGPIGSKREWWISNN